MYKLSAQEEVQRKSASEKLATHFKERPQCPDIVPLESVPVGSKPSSFNVQHCATLSRNLYLMGQANRKGGVRRDYTQGRVLGRNEIQPAAEQTV